MKAYRPVWCNCCTPCSHAKILVLPMPWRSARLPGTIRLLTLPRKYKVCSFLARNMFAAMIAEFYCVDTPQEVLP